MTPGPYTLVLLVLAAFRLTRLIGWDDLPPVVRARAWLLGERIESRSRPAGQNDVYVTLYRRPTLAKMVQCAYCMGWWVSLVLYLLWALVGAPGREHWSHWTMWGIVPLGVSSAVGLIARTLDP